MANHRSPLMGARQKLVKPVIPVILPEEQKVEEVAVKPIPIIEEVIAKPVINVPKPVIKKTVNKLDN